MNILNSPTATILLTAFTAAAVGSLGVAVFRHVRRARADGYLTRRDLLRAGLAFLYAASPAAVGTGIAEWTKGSYLWAGVWIVPGVLLFAVSAALTRPWARWSK